MSKLRKFLDRLKNIPDLLRVFGELRELLRKSCPPLYAVLDALVANQHRQAAVEFLSWGSVVDLVGYVLRIGEDAAKILLGTEAVVAGATRGFERLDALLDEEKLIAFMELLRLPRTT